MSIPSTHSTSRPVSWHSVNAAQCAGESMSNSSAGSDQELLTMMELELDVSKEYVSLRSVASTPMAEMLAFKKVSEAQVLWADPEAPRRPARSLPVIPRQGDLSATDSFRERVKTSVGGAVRRLSQQLDRNPRNVSRVVDMGCFGVPPDFVDPELGRCGSFTKMQKSRSQAEHAIAGLKRINKAAATADQMKSWPQVEARFFKLANADNLLPRSNFPECIGMKDSKDFANELYDAFVRRRGEKVINCISKDELYEYWLEITNKSFEGRMQIFFDLCDKDMDGRITGKEVKEVILLSASANKLSKLKDQAAECAALIMDELDKDQHGYIELNQLQTLMQGSVQGFGKDAIEKVYNHMLTTENKRPRVRKIMDRVGYFLRDNWKRLWILALWISVMAGLFTWKFLEYRQHEAFHIMGYCLCAAKGAAETLKLNMALILLPVSRNTITRLRSTPLGRIIPFDDNLKFHKIIAGGIIAGLLVHVLSHATCDIPKLTNASEELFFKHLGDHFVKQPSYVDIIRMPVGYTGILMVLLMTIAFLLAANRFRRNLVQLPWPFHRLTGFNAFWYSHHLFVVVYILLLVHSILLLLHKPWYDRTTWMYIGVSVLLYAGERILRMFRAFSKVDVVKAAIYPGNVLAIHTTKPAGFKYKSGMYLFLQCPEISPFEWHPFSITSAPDDPFLSVHIRTLGDWTNEMKKIFSEALGGQTRLQIQNNFGLSGEISKVARFPKLHIDGPYGAPAQDYLKYDVLLLVGLGIGATPFISILKDMLHHNKASDLNAASELLSPKKPKKKLMRKPKAYFYWVTREQGSFDWFRGVMRDVEEIDNKESIEMHNYLTSVYEEGDARSNLVMMLQALHHAKNGVDLVSGTRARTHFARPNWKSVFSKLAATHKDKRVGVFYCGPATVAKQLEELSRTYTQKSTTKFSFHKENF
ncbi:hypothetical protein M758_11G114300 [Ceratodon purpureus]|nr:hypothetical protein M758_11G114300 [Ceratodon purpureus]